MEGGVGGTTILGDGGLGRHVAEPSQCTYLAESSAKTSAERSQRS